MSHSILVLNAGSSTVKYRLFHREGENDYCTRAKGLLELSPTRLDENPESAFQEALESMVETLRAGGQLVGQGPSVIGHRVVHGGSLYSKATRISEEVMVALASTLPLAPLHNPANLLGIEVCRRYWPDIPQVAVFDTAFHQSMPPASFRYPVPDDWYQQHAVRRYGFHGSSYASILRSAAAYFGRAASGLNLIVFHLGNGASACAIQNGQSRHTSMGMTPLSGLVMGTRSGDLDPGILFYLAEAKGLTFSQMDDLLNHASGLKGLSGDSDMRKLLERHHQGDAAASLALEVFIERIRDYLGAYLLKVQPLDAIIFTGGIGEHALEIVERICADLDDFGIVLAKLSAVTGPGIQNLSETSSRIPILIIPTDEEMEIALQTAELLSLNETGAP
jgi:acetate kinase